jgi:hypothetical protein
MAGYPNWRMAESRPLTLPALDASWLGLGRIKLWLGQVKKGYAGIKSAPIRYALI